MKNDQENKTFTFSTIQISLIGVLMGLGLVLSRVAIPLGTTNRLSLGFVVTAVISMLFGPWVGGFAALGVDLLTSFIFGQQGVFFIGFTLTAFVNGVIYGNDTLRVQAIADSVSTTFSVVTQSLLPGDYYAIAFAENGMGRSTAPDTILFTIE